MSEQEKENIIWVIKRFIIAKNPDITEDELGERVVSIFEKAFNRK